MLHAVLLLVTAGQLVLLDHAVEIVVNECPDNKTVLGLAVHRLGIDIVVVLCVLNEPTIVLKLLEVLGCLLIHTGVVLTRANRKINLRLNDMIEAHLIVACLCPRLFRVKYVVRT